MINEKTSYLIDKIIENKNVFPVRSNYVTTNRLHILFVSCFLRTQLHVHSSLSRKRNKFREETDLLNLSLQIDVFERDKHITSAWK